jgi:hypothetical protein
MNIVISLVPSPPGGSGLREPVSNLLPDVFLLKDYVGIFE